jgi:putative hydrolase of the HAD superfamily
MVTRKDVDALLFDLGGVVIEINFDRAFEVWAAHAQVLFTTVKGRFTFDEHYRKHERGEIDGQQYFASLRLSIGIDLTDEQFTEGWNSIYIKELPNIQNHLSCLSKKYPLYAFTNSNPTHRTVWEVEYREALSHFRIVFNSSDMGVRKPEAEAFYRISRVIGIPIHRILFFDDTEENVAGAKAIGMQAIQVRSVADIEQVTTLLLAE